MRSSLVALTLGLANPAIGQPLEVVGAFEFPTESVTGLSGIEVSGDGSSFVAISDKGWWMEGRFEREAGAISGVVMERLLPVLDPKGLPVSARRTGDWSDTEGLAIGADGTAWVSFERYAHVSRYDSPTAAASGVRDHPTFYDHAENRQLEAIAVAPDGTLYTFSEAPLDDGFPVYRLEGAEWTIDGYLPQRDRFSIVGADFDDNGDLYILERKLAFLIWWQTRIRRVSLEGFADEILWTSARGEYGNLEGIALWRDDAGLRITTVSDNNGSKREATRFVEFRLTE